MALDILSCQLLSILGIYRKELLDLTMALKKSMIQFDPSKGCGIKMDVTSENDIQSANN